MRTDEVLCGGGFAGKRANEYLNKYHGWQEYHKKKMKLLKTVVKLICIQRMHSSADKPKNFYGFQHIKIVSIMAN